MKIQAFSTNSISESIVAFAQFARSHGMNVGIQETQDAFLALNEIKLTNRNSFKYTLKPLFCTSPEEGKLFEKLFLLYWDTNPIDLNDKSKTIIKGAQKKKQPGSIVMLGEGKKETRIEEGKNVAGASETERLRKTDFSKINDIDAKLLEQIADKLFKEMALRLRRRMKENRRRGQINLRRTIRRSISSGGEPIDLFYRGQKPKRQRLVVLLDVSGSMDKYSFFLLRFVFALRENFRQLEAFIFSTKLVRITGAVLENQLEYATALLSRQVDNWSSGTKIGKCLEEFNERYGKRILNGSPTMIILSDGLDTGDPEILRNELKKIHGKTRKIVWLNPLIGMKDYQPIQKGMEAAIPCIDDFRAAHNLESLLELENILRNV